MPGGKSPSPREGGELHRRLQHEKRSDRTTRIHLRMAVRQSAMVWHSLIWKAQLAPSSDGKLKAARRAEIRMKLSVKGNRNRPSRPERKVRIASAPPHPA